MLDFKITKKFKKGSLRRGRIKLGKKNCQTPIFMPVGTVGAVKTVTPWELEKLGAETVLANTYHLHLRPGEKTIKKLGGLHEFMKWPRLILTDSGGYQVFSLAKNQVQSSKFKVQNLIKITGDGVEFKSHLDGSKHFFTPEKVVQIQLDLGSDIIMPLDVCPPAEASKNEVNKAVELTIAWLKRSKDYLDKKMKTPLNPPLPRGETGGSPALFGIVQGGTFADLRKYCVNKIIKLDLPGYAIGGLAVGENKQKMWQVVEQMNDLLPKDKPRYLMGVGTPDDLIKATSLGIDMFDCVLPTRLARHGAVFAKVNSKQLAVNRTNYKKINLLNAKYSGDKKPLDTKCGCPTCKEGFSRLYLHHLMKEGEILGHRLLTLHNLYIYLELMGEIRKNIR